MAKSSQVLAVAGQENVGWRPEENQVEALCVQNTTFEEFAFFPFRRIVSKHVTVVQIFLGRGCKTIVARTVAPNLFRRMCSVAWPQVRRSNQG